MIDFGQCTAVVVGVRRLFGRLADGPIRTQAMRLVRESGVALDQGLDYERDALPFALAFWERNFWKAVYFYAYEYVQPTLLSRYGRHDGVVNIAVLGSGSAADAAALLLWLDRAAPTLRVQLKLIDRCPRQLELARGVLRMVEKHLKNIHARTTYRCLDFDDWNPCPNSEDLVVMSHFITEYASVEDAVSKAVSALRPRGDLVAIERMRDPVWRNLRDVLGLSGMTAHDMGISADKVRLFLSHIPPDARDMTPVYVRAHVPENKHLMALVRGYFRAWRRQSPDDLLEIFTPHATYDEKPGIRPVMAGLDAIRDYWEEYPVRQKNIRLGVHAVAYSDTVGVCSWEGEFDTPKAHVSISGSMNFYLDPYLGKINRFTEYFGTIKTPLAA